MLEKLGVGCGVNPICQWSYEQPLAQGGTQRIPPSGCAGSDTKLVSEVRQFRINAGIDIGDVAADVAAYIRRESPINDRFPGRTYESSAEALATSLGRRPYIERIKDWLRAISAKRPRLVIEDEADARAEVCQKCPHNVPWRTGCLPCVEQIEYVARNVRQRASYKHDKKLGACRLHDFHVSSAVFVDRESLPELNPNAPAECWMRKVA